jgi:hypothetical protein
MTIYPERTDLENDCYHLRDKIHTLEHLYDAIDRTEREIFITMNGFHTETIDETPYASEYNQMKALFMRWKLKIFNNIKRIEC